MLTHDQMLELARAATNAELTPETLRTGLPASFAASLQRSPKPAEQLLLDLQAMISAGTLLDGSVPLRTWLRNAQHHAGQRREAVIFQQALASLGAAPGAPAAREREAPRVAGAGGREPAIILFLGANPSSTTRLALDQEVREIEQRLRSAELRDAFVVKQAWAVRASDLQASLLQHRPRVLHFSGHGEDTGELLLEDDRGMARPVPVPALSGLFRVLGKSIRCVVLNACYSEVQARAIAEHVDCVVGMSAEIPDEASIAFSGAFYQALGYGESVQTAFDLGCNQIALLGQAGDADDGVPVLVERAGVKAADVRLGLGGNVARP